MGHVGAHRRRKPYQRALLAIAGAFSIALSVLGWQVHEAGYAHAATHENRMCIGSNRGVWDKFHVAVPQSHCVRTYYDVTDVFPAQWPTSAGHGTWQMITIRPSYKALMSGSLDTKIHGFCASAPPHSFISIYQENAGGNPLDYPPSIHNPAHFVAMQKRMSKLCAGTPARFGVIIIAPYADVLNWVYSGDGWFGYDFFAFDRYLNPNGTINVRAVTTRMDAQLRTLKSFTGRRCPIITLPETGVSHAYQAMTWYTTLTHWFATHDCHRVGWILTRWIPKGTGSGLVGSWPPAVRVVALLKHLAWRFQ